MSREEFTLPLYLGETRTEHQALVVLTDLQVQVRLPRGLVQFERKKFLRALATNCWSRFVEFHEDVPEQAMTWHFFQELKRAGVYGHQDTLARKEAA